MGDAVNQAARFEPACKIFGVLIMIGESTYEMAVTRSRCANLACSWPSKQAVGVYELLKKGELMPKRPSWFGSSSAWEIYASGQFFRQAVRVRGVPIMDDEPSRIYAAQCEQFIKNPPPEGWARSGSS